MFSLAGFEEPDSERIRDKQAEQQQPKDEAEVPVLARQAVAHKAARVGVRPEQCSDPVLTVDGGPQALRPPALLRIPFCGQQLSPLSAHRSVTSALVF